MNQATKILSRTLFTCSTLLALSACGGSDSGTSTAPTGGGSTVVTKTGKFIDSAVAGVDYYIDGAKAGSTNAAGEFSYPEGKSVTFKVGSVTLGTASGDLTTVSPASFGLDATKVSNILVFLQTLDSDANPANGISLDPALVAKMTTAIDLTTAANLTAIQQLIPGKVFVQANAAIAHFASTAGVGGTAAAPSIQTAVDKAVGIWYFACDGEGRSQVSVFDKTGPSSIGFSKRLVRDYANTNCTGAIVNSFSDTSSTDKAQILGATTLADGRIVGTVYSEFVESNGQTVRRIEQISVSATGTTIIVTNSQGTATFVKVNTYAFPN